MSVITGEKCCKYLLYIEGNSSIYSNNIISVYFLNPNLYEITSNLKLNELGQYLIKILNAHFSLYEFSGNRFYN